MTLSESPRSQTFILDPMDTEKGAAVHGKFSNLDSETSSTGYSEGGDLQVIRKEGDSVKVAKDGVTVLIPQPSDDPHDPLNWSSLKKNVVLGVVVWASMVSSLPMELTERESYTSPITCLRSTS